MPTTITCPSCGLQGHVPDGFAAPGANCPRCQTYIPLTGAQPPAPAVAHAGNPGSAIDAFFAHVAAQSMAHGQAPMVAAPPPPLPAAGAPEAAPPLPPQPPADAATAPASPTAEREWVSEEKQRLDGYMARQFAVLRQQREEFSRWRSEVEAALVGREQELNRQGKHLAGRTEELDHREAGVQLQEAGAAQAAEKMAVLEERLAEVQELLGRLQLDTDAERFQLQELRELAEPLLKSAAAAAAETEKVQGQIKHNREALEKQQQLLQAYQLEMERRYAALDEAEQAMQRRIAELDQVEANIRRDVERQRQQPAGKRGSTDAVARELDQARQELDQLRKALKQAEGWEERERRYRQAVHQRNQAIEVLQNQLAQKQGGGPPPAGLAELRRQVATLEQETARLRQAINTRDSYWQQQLATAVQQREERLKQEIAAMQAQLAKERAEKEALQRRSAAPPPAVATPVVKKSS